MRALGIGMTAPEARWIRQNRLFAGVPVDIVSNIGTNVEWFWAEQNEVIFREGDVGDCLYLVSEGTVRMSKAGRNGKQETLGFILAGEFFGEMALIDGQQRSAQATAVTACGLGRIAARMFDHVWALAPYHAYLNALRCEVERLRGTNSRCIGELLCNERLSLVGAMANAIIHDLKNQLGVICSAAELIAPHTTNPQVTKFTQLIRKSTDRMVSMIQELLDFSRGQSSFQLQRQSVKTVLDEFDHEMLQCIPANVHLVRKYDNAGEVMVDVRSFSRLLLNLVKNAIEAMPNGGQLQIEVERTPGGAIFKISDTGCGIAPELQSRIFEPFVTIGKAQGTGLGLAIVQSVVDAHGGQISLTSQVGVGTTFTVSLPGV